MTRLANSSDEPSIYNALHGLECYAKQYEWAVAVDFEKSYEAIMGEVAAGKAYVVEGYLVMTEVVTPWYSTKSLLQEWLVLKLYKGGSLKALPEALVAIAGRLGCVGVITADSSPVNIVGKAYEESGFTPLTRSFFRKVGHGVSQTSSS